MRVDPETLCYGGKKNQNIVDISDIIDSVGTEGKGGGEGKPLYSLG